MSKLSQSQLEHKVEILTKNGQNANAQAVISSVGYTPTRLDEGAGLLTAVQQSHVAVPAALQVQKQATDTEALARQAAKKEMVSLAETCRTLFADDEPVLTALGLLTQHQTITDADGKETTVAVRPSEATADVIQRWRSQLDVLGELGSDPIAKLTEAGWPAERVTEARALVEAYTQADADQQAAIQAYKTAMDQQAAGTEALRDWYSTAAGLCKRAIKDADPHNHQNLTSLLEL